MVFKGSAIEPGNVIYELLQNSVYTGIFSLFSGSKNFLFQRLVSYFYE